MEGQVGSHVETFNKSLDVKHFASRIGKDVLESRSLTGLTHTVKRHAPSFAVTIG